MTNDTKHPSSNQTDTRCDATFLWKPNVQQNIHETRKLAQQIPDAKVRALGLHILNRPTHPYKAKNRPKEQVERYQRVLAPLGIDTQIDPVVLEVVSDPVPTMPEKKDNRLLWSVMIPSIVGMAILLIYLFGPNAPSQETSESTQTSINNDKKPPVSWQEWLDSTTDKTEKLWSPERLSLYEQQPSQKEQDTPSRVTPQPHPTPRSKELVTLTTLPVPPPKPTPSLTKKPSAMPLEANKKQPFSPKITPKVANPSPIQQTAMESIPLLLDQTLKSPPIQPTTVQTVHPVISPSSTQPIAVEEKPPVISPPSIQPIAVEEKPPVISPPSIQPIAVEEKPPVISPSSIQPTTLVDGPPGLSPTSIQPTTLADGPPGLSETSSQPTTLVDGPPGLSPTSSQPTTLEDGPPGLSPTSIQPTTLADGPPGLSETSSQPTTLVDGPPGLSETSSQPTTLEDGPPGLSETSSQPTTLADGPPGLSETSNQHPIPEIESSPLIMKKILTQTAPPSETDTSTIRTTSDETTPPSEQQQTVILTPPHLNDPQSLIEPDISTLGITSDQPPLITSNPQTTVDLPTIQAESASDQSQTVPSDPLLENPTSIPTDPTPSLADPQQTLALLQPTQPDTIPLNEQAIQSYNLGLYGPAADSFQESLIAKEETFGANHPFVASSLNNLGSTYASMGRTQEAEPLLKHSLEIKEKVLGADNPELAPILGNLSALYSQQGRYGEAQPLQERQLAIHEKLYGHDHPQVALDLNNLARNHSVQGNANTAEGLFKRAITILEKDPQANQNTLPIVLLNYAELLRALNQNQQATDLENRAEAIRSQNYSRSP